MSYYWQINWEVQKIKWTICKRIGFSPLHSIVQPVILFLSEWTGKGVSTSSTSDALIIISKGVLGRVFCSWWKLFQIMFGVDVFVTSQSQDCNTSFWLEEMRTFVLIAYFFLACFLTNQQLIHKVSLTLADGYFKTSKKKKDLLSHHCVLSRDIQVSFLYFWSCLFLIILCVMMFI